MAKIKPTTKPQSAEPPKLSLTEIRIADSCAALEDIGRNLNALDEVCGMIQEHSTAFDNPVAALGILVNVITAKVERVRKDLEEVRTDKGQ